MRLEIVDVVVVPVNHPRLCNVVATLLTDCDCWFVIATVSVPLVLFAIVVVVKEQEYWLLVSQALSHAAKPGTTKTANARINVIIASFFATIFEPQFNLYFVFTDYPDPTPIVFEYVTRPALLNDELSDNHIVWV